MEQTLNRERRASPIIAAVLAGAASLAAYGCGRSDASKALAAIQARFPDGHRRCIGLGGLTGIKVARPRDGILFYPQEGPTSPLEHGFFFYAAKSNAPVPEPVHDLVHRGLLHVTTVDATVYVETNARGQQTASLLQDAGAGPFMHSSEQFGVDVYETDLYDKRFEYALQVPHQTTWAPPNTFPSKTYDVPITAGPQHWPVPTVEPYALSIVSAACLIETPERVTAIRVLDAADGGKFEEATVEWEQHPPAWMSSDAFRKAVLRPETVWIDKPRVGTSVLTLNDGQPKYVREKGFW